VVVRVRLSRQCKRTENLIERALILSAGPRIEVGEWLPLPRISASGRELSKLEQLERNPILKRIEARGKSCFGGQRSWDQPNDFMAGRMRAYQIEPTITDEADVSE
jgi:hypothetical protein